MKRLLADGGNSPKQARFVNATEEQQQSNKMEDVATDVDSRILPINCPEKIVFVVDCGSETGSQCGRFTDGSTSLLLDVIKKAIAVLVSRKAEISPNSQFGLIEWRGVIHWRAELAKGEAQILSALSKLQPSLVSEDLCDINQIVKFVKNETNQPIIWDGETAPDYVVRTIIIYARCQPPPTVDERPQYSDYFTLDILYIHFIDSPKTNDHLMQLEDTPDEETENGESLAATVAQSQEVYNELLSWGSDSSYILSTSARAFTLMKESIRFLAHPLQRPPQHLANYRVNKPSSRESSSDNTSSLSQENVLVDIQS